MGHLTDEMLMAYADGELDPADRLHVESSLASDPAARERLEIFVATGVPIAQLYSKPMHEPVPSHLITTVMQNTSSRVEFQNGNGDIGNRSGQSPVGLLEILKNAMFGKPTWTTAVAWGIPALVVAIGVTGYIHHHSKEPELVALKQGQIFAQGPLKKALETTPSGSAVSLGTSKDTAFTIRAILTFKNRHQTFCRQYEVTTSVENYAGIACRDNEEQWRLEIHMATAQHGSTMNRIVPAGKGTAAIEAAVNNVMEGDALGPQDEETLIQKKWLP